MKAEAPPQGAQSNVDLPHVASQILLKREAGTTVAIVENLLAAFGGSVLVTSARSEIDIASIGNDVDLAAAIAVLAADPRIDYAEPNYLSSLWATPNDLEFPQQWSKENNGVNAPGGLGHAGADLNLVDAWDTQSVAPGVIIAIIDDSVETAHVDLAMNVMASGRCFASPNSARPCTNGPNDPNPADGNDFHGTLVAGTAAARGDNGIGVAGAAWETNLLPLKVDLSYFAIVEAIDEAIVQSADIINMSFGGPIETRSLSDAIGRAEAAGILMIASAGNADANNGIAVHYPSDSTANNILSIAASDSRDRLSGFSQWGSHAVHLAAPGDRVRTTANGNSFATASGTSFSAPHVAGVAALVYEHTGTSNYRRVKAQLLHGTVDGRDALGPVNPGLDKAAIPGRVATGRLDADAALAGLSGGVILVQRVAVDDGTGGNGNGRLDPGETALLEITLRNVWQAESAVTGVLSTVDNAELFINDINPVSFGQVGKDAESTAAFSVTLSNAVSGHRQLFLQLDLASASNPALASRYFYLEVGTLRNGQTTTQDIQRYNWDEFQGFSIDVPAGASDLVISTSGPGDVDLLLRHDDPPEYLISLDTVPGDGFYYVDDDTEISANDDANESLTVANPVPGTYHAVVVNFDQQAKTYDITANYNLPNTGTIEFSAATFNVTEDAGVATITVTRSGAIGGAFVDYASSDGTAVAGDDYGSTSGTLSWGLGENGSKRFTVPIIDDQDTEQAESLQLSLSNVTGSTLGANDTASLEIADNESLVGEMAFTRSSRTVSEGAGQISVTVVRSAGSAGEATIDYATQAGQAAPGADFSAASGTLNWADGESGPKTFQIGILEDSAGENREVFTVVLSNATGATLGTPATLSVSINDNESSAAPQAAGGGGPVGPLGSAVLLFWLLVRGRRGSGGGFGRWRCRIFVWPGTGPAQSNPVDSYLI